MSTAPRRVLVLSVAVTFLTGCFGVLPTPIPTSPSERSALDVRGVVVGRGPDDGDGEHIEFRDVQRVDWTNDAVSIVGVPRAGERAGQMTERTFSLTDVSALLVRQIDAGKTSAIIGGTIVGAAAIIAILVTGTNQNIVPTR